MGGNVQRVARLGDKWTYQVDLRPMFAWQSRPLIALLLQGLDAKVLCPIVIPGIDTSAATDAVAVSGGGRSMIVTGDTTTKSLGQHFSLVANGVRYLHQITAITDQTIKFIPTLKVKIAGGEVLEFREPKIEGFLDGNEQSWTVGLVSNVGLTFKINEAQ